MWGHVTEICGAASRHLHQARDEDGVGGGALRLAERVEDHLAVLRLGLGVEVREQLHERLHREHRPKVGHRRALLQHVRHHPLQLRLQLQVGLLRRDALDDVAQQLAHLVEGELLEQEADELRGDRRVLARRLDLGDLGPNVVDDLQLRLLRRREGAHRRAERDV